MLSAPWHTHPQWRRGPPDRLDASDSLVVGHGQKIRTTGAKHFDRSLRIENIFMKRILRNTRQVIMHPSPKGLRSQPLMHQPFVIPTRFEGRIGYPCHTIQSIRRAKRNKAPLCQRPLIGMVTLQRRTHGQQNQTDVEKRRKTLCAGRSTSPRSLCGSPLV